MTVRDLERVSLPRTRVKISNSEGEEIYNDIFERLVGDIWNKEVLYIYPYNHYLKICIRGV